MPVLAAVPVKRFFVAKRRLAPLLPARARSRLGRDLARHTMTAVAQAGAEVIALAADSHVAAWAKENGWDAVEDPGGGLDGAATAFAAAASSRERPWLVIHADLPLLRAADLAPALDALETGDCPIAPSDDGGTSLVGGTAPMRFSYGPGSFHRHLARLPGPRVVVRKGLVLDLDGPADFAAASLDPNGAWLRRYGAGT
ncbi:MAG: 2-phospho-L-lactate guanylyltransferase [Actinomycetota bacterium]